MIYSVHDPRRGGFRYFEAGPDTPINDDLPTPTYPPGLQSRAGVASSLASRPLPAGAREVGYGQLPMGSISSGMQGAWTSTAKGVIPSGLGGLEVFSNAVNSILPTDTHGAYITGLCLITLLAGGYVGWKAHKAPRGKKLAPGIGAAALVLFTPLYWLGQVSDHGFGGV